MIADQSQCDEQNTEAQTQTHTNTTLPHYTHIQLHKDKYQQFQNEAENRKFIDPVPLGSESKVQGLRIFYSLPHSENAHICPCVTVCMCSEGG